MKKQLKHYRKEGLMSEQIDAPLVAKAICESRSFDLLETVGQGTFKETFKISDSSSKYYALKIFKSGKLDTRTEREIDAMTRCNHPNIAKIIEINTHEEIPYLIEDYFDGGTLHNKIVVNGLMEYNEILDLGRSLIEAIEHIASLKLVHRDIKPENILFRSNDENPILTDFGIVRDLEATSLTKTMWQSGPCTPPYAAPEQLNNDKNQIDWRTDQFSLAITLANCMFGNHPFMLTGESIHNAISRVANREKTSPEFDTFVEETEMHAFTRMLGGWPVNRYLTPQELLVAWEEQRR